MYDFYDIAQVENHSWNKTKVHFMFILEKDVVWWFMVF